MSSKTGSKKISDLGSQTQERGRTTTLPTGFMISNMQYLPINLGFKGYELHYMMFLEQKRKRKMHWLQQSGPLHAMM